MKASSSSSAPTSRSNSVTKEKSAAVCGSFFDLEGILSLCSRGLEGICPRRTGALRGQRPISFRGANLWLVLRQQTFPKWGYRSFAAVQHFPHRQKAPAQMAPSLGNLSAGEIKPSSALGGVQRGQRPLCAFFPTAFFAKKAVLPLSKRPARRAQKSPPLRRLTRRSHNRHDL